MLGDDVFIGYVRIGAPSYGTTEGTFYTANNFSFDDSVIKYLYIRFFDTTNYPVAGDVVDWNTSAVFGITSEFFKVNVDFRGNYQTSITTTFVIIPEPSSSYLLLLFLGLAFGMRAVMKKEARKERISHRRG